MNPRTTLVLVLASANPDKAAEIRSILHDSLGDAIDLLDRPTEVPDVEETGSTLEGNARLKASALLKATGIAAIADDTGLEVDALGGDPGVYSARFAGPDATYKDNVDKLLEVLQGVEDRRARFRTVALVAFPDGSEMVAEGSVLGAIATGPRGKGGFGYDPLFVPDEGEGRTFAELSSDQKHAISHRGRAFRALSEALEARMEP